MSDKNFEFLLILFWNILTFCDIKSFVNFLCAVGSLSTINSKLISDTKTRNLVEKTHLSSICVYIQVGQSVEINEIIYTLLMYMYFVGSGVTLTGSCPSQQKCITCHYTEQRGKNHRLMISQTVHCIFIIMSSNQDKSMVPGTCITCVGTSEIVHCIIII